MYQVKKRNKYIRKSFLLIVTMVMVLSGCRSTRYIPDDRYLLSDIDIEIDNKAIDKIELATYIRQKENLKILGLFKFHLWMYNLSSKDKERGWLKRIGEPPVVYDEGLKNKTAQQLKQYLNNKGYYRAEVTDTVLYKNHKAKIKFNIETDDPYVVQQMSYTVNDSLLIDFVLSRKGRSLIKEGDVFDVDVLQKERERITTGLRNQGYFRFAEEFIHFKVDTTKAEKMVDLEIIVEKANIAIDIEQENHKKYLVRDYEIFIDRQRKGMELIRTQQYTDSTLIDGYKFYHNGNIPIKKDLLIKTFDITPGDFYSKRLEDRTYSNLYELKQFNYVNVQFVELPDKKDSLTGYLREMIFLPLQTRQNYSFEIEGTNTDANLGVAGNINYQHRNLLGGAEIFDFNIKGGTERQIIDSDNRKFITVEFGVTPKLTIPGFIFPIISNNIQFFSTPYTFISTAFNYQKRPNYTRTIINTTFGYLWRSSRYNTHSFSLLDLNAVKIFNLNADFMDGIKDLYIKSSYIDHIISASSYSFIYNSQSSLRRPDYRYFKMNIEAAGNALWGLSILTNREKVYLENQNAVAQLYHFEYFDTRFAQYLKGDFEYRYGYRYDKFNVIATRAFVGIAYPYGNFNVMPFEKRYFTGGANGIRAWQVRSLGPGTYASAIGEYPNQSADIKLEANIEYRFKLFWMFEGALFLDGGNIWAINELDNRPGAVFNFDSFYQEFALGTGFGLRMVTSYFILRADVGLKLRDPSLEMGKRWIPVERRYNSSDLNINIAIGYPF